MDRKIMGLFMVFSIGVLMISGCVSKEAKIDELRVTEPEETGGKVLKLGVQPCWSPSNSFTMFSPLVDYLSEETGLDIKLVVVETEKEFHETVKEVDFTLQDAFSVYIHNKRIAALDPLVIAVSENGESEERGAIIVRADSDIKSISDLRGKTFLFGGAHNAPKFFATYVTLKKSGIDPVNDLKSYDFGGDCSDNAMSVFLGEYDAGAVCKDFVEGEEGKGKFNFKTDLRIVADTIPVPNWMLTASENADKAAVEKVRKALLKISPESSIAEEILEETEWAGFEEVTGRELTKIDELVQEYSVPLLEEYEGGILKLAVQPTTKPAVALERYQPIVDYLKGETNLDMELIVSDNYTDFSALQKEGKVDFVIQDSFSTYLIGKHTKLTPIASVISPQGKFCDFGHIIVRADSDIKDLNDLKGKTFLFGPKANAAKFLAPYVLFKESGIDVEKDLAYEFGGLCPDNAMSVFVGEYDASVVCELYMAQKDRKFNLETDLRCIADTECLPYWIVSSSEKTDKAVVDKIKQALLELDMENPKTDEVLGVCKWKGFVEYSDELNKIDELVEKYAVPIK